MEVREAVAKALIKAAADVNKAGDTFGETLLHIARQNRHESVAQILMDAGAV